MSCLVATRPRTTKVLSRVLKPAELSRFFEAGQTRANVLSEFAFSAAATPCDTATRPRRASRSFFRRRLGPKRDREIDPAAPPRATCRPPSPCTGTWILGPGRRRLRPCRSRDPPRLRRGRAVGSGRRWGRAIGRARGFGGGLLVCVRCGRSAGCGARVAAVARPLARAIVRWWSYGGVCGGVARRWIVFERCVERGGDVVFAFTHRSSRRMGARTWLCPSYVQYVQFGRREEEILFVKNLHTVVQESSDITPTLAHP